ncbi:collagen binding domain-containing protein [Enterococcus saigonensis]|nr:collagen binding domain-containing protein [Enterococcus saigonensis]
MMGKQKYNYRIVYLFMALLLFMQGMTPLVAVAQTVTNDWTLEAIQQDGDQLLLTVKGKNEKEATIKYSDNVDLTNAKWQSGSVVPAVHIDNQNKKITLAKSQTQKEDVLILQTKANTLQQLRSDITFTYGSQQLAFAAEQTSSTTTSPTTESTEKSSDTATQITSTSESVTTENPKSSEGTKESDTSDSALAPAATDNKKPADNPNDIRTYFPNGEGTIITDSQIFFTDKDGKPIEPPIPADATIRMTYDWAIPESVRQKIKAGDYFEFHLPAELVPSREMSGALKDAQGNTYANYVVGKDGTVRFTFTEDVVNSSDITGDFYFETHFETNHIDGPGDITIHYPTEDNLPPVDVTIRPATETQIDKQGHFDKTPNPSKVAWTVDINQAMKEHTNLTITETWPQGIAYDSVKVYELVMNLDGTVKEVSRQLAPSEYTVDQNGNVKIKGKTNNAYRLIYQSTIKESAIPDKGGKVSFTNEAALTSEEVTDDLTAKATVTNSYGKLLEKKQTGYNSDKQEFSWQIKYNYGEKNISKEQAVLTDTMSENLTFEPDSLVLHRITFDKNGKEIIGAELTSPADYQVVYDTSKNQFVLKFAHDVNYAVKIDYKTKVNTLVTGNTDVDNQVVVDTGGDGQEGGDDGTAQQQNIIKNLGNVDYANKTAIWKLEVNKNNYYMENAVITDTFQPIPGLSLAQSHLTESKYDLTIETKSGKKLFAKQDYDLTVQKNQAGQQTGFTIKFIGEYAKTTESFIIYYKTNFDVTGLDPDGKTGPDSFINHATITWTDKEGGKHHSDDEKPFKPHDPFTLNAQKSGVYNAVTKEITWTIVVNLSHNQLHNATLTDQIIDNQSYVDGSLKVFNAQTQPDGNVYINEKDEVTNQMQAIKEPTGDNDQTLSLHFPEGIANTYAIVFKTSLADKVIEGSKEYDNVADYENNNDDRKVTGEVSVYHGGETLAKEGLQDPDDPDYVLWHVTINGAQSTLDDVVITDHPSINQVLDEDSVVLYQTQVAEDGTITPDKTKPLVAGKDYTLEVKTDNETGQQTLEVKMAHIETAYYMEYRSLILSSTTGSQDKVSNNVTIKGTGTKVIEGSDGQDVTVQVDNSGGNASGKRGKIVIQKTKEDGQTPLSGAHFQLLDMKKEHVLREGTVTEDGKITFGGLPLGSYKLVETQAPTGFTISDELAAGKTIEITEATTEEDAPSLIIKNEPNKVILKKVGEQGTVLPNAQFRLEKLTSKIVGSSFWQEIPLLQQSRTDENGILEVDGLETGIYRFVEVFAPSGFVRDETSHIFVV